MSFKALIFLALFVITMADKPTIQEQWADFKTKFEKSYPNAEEEARRFAIFQDNVKVIEEHNKKFEAGESTYSLGVNDFTDLTNEEFQKTHLGYKRD